MNEKEKKIVKAAKEVFHRYGVKRASMNDIASEAGIARQTLYNSFSNKNEVLQAAIRLYTENNLAALADGLPAREGLKAKLDFIFDLIAVQVYAELHASPNAQDLMDGYNAAGRAELAEGYARYRDVIQAELVPYAPTLAARGLSPEALAELVQRAVASYKYEAENLAHLKRLVSDLASFVVAAALPNQEKTA